MNTPAPSLPLRSRRIFRVADYWDNIAANHAASDYAARYTRGQYPWYQAPRLFVSWDKTAAAYFVEPNPDFTLARNDAWFALCADETREFGPVASPRL